MQITIRVPDDIINEADAYIDNIHFRSRAHLITVVLSEWLETQKENDEYEDEFEEEDDEEDEEDADV